MGFPEHADYWPEPVERAFDLIGRNIGPGGAPIVAVGLLTNFALFDRAHPGPFDR